MVLLCLFAEKMLGGEEVSTSFGNMALLHESFERTPSKTKKPYTCLLLGIRSFRTSIIEFVKSIQPMQNYCVANMRRVIR